MAEAIGRAKVILEIDAASYSAALDKANSKLKMFGQQAASAGHATVSSMQASSGALRLVQGNIENNIRAVERLLTTIPGVGKALQAIFPLVGAAAFAGMLYKVGEEAVAAIKKIEGMAGVVRDAFAQMNMSAQKSADALNASTDKIREATALLEHKSTAKLGLITELDEARVKADELAESLTRDYTEAKKLLDANQNGFFAQLMGKGATSDVTGEITKQLANVATLAHMQDQALHPRNQDGSRRAVTPADEADAAGYDQKIRAAQQAAIQYANQQIAMRGPGGRFHYGDDGQVQSGANAAGVSSDYSKSFGNQGVNLEGLTALKTMMEKQEDLKDAADDNISAQAAQKKAQANKQAIEDAKKAAAELLKVDEQELKAKNAFNKLSINEELSYWADKVTAFKAGSEQFITVSEKMSDLIASRSSLFNVNKETQAKLGKSDVEGGDILGAAQEKLITAPAIAQNERSTESAEKYNEAVSKGLEIQYRAKATYDQTAVSIALAEGTISRLGAAHELATIHGLEQAAALKKINDELATQIELIKHTKLTDEDRANAIRNANAGADNQRAEVNTQGQQQAQQDAASIYGATATGKTVQALNEMVNAWDNMSASIVSVFTRAADQLNGEMSEAILGGSHKKIGEQVGATLHGAASGLMKSALEKGESAIGKALGFGGDKVSHVIVDNFPGGGGGAVSQGLHGLAGKAVGWLGGLLGKGGGATSVIPDGGYDFGTNPLTGLLGAMPMLAGGGDMPAGSSAIVGEKGKEIFTTKSAGRIIPNHEIGGGGTSHTYMIDARGATDPAAIHAAVARALPHAVAASMQAQHQHAKRTPAGR